MKFTNGTCTQEGCDRPSVARQMCSTHWSRWRRGQPSDVGAGPWRGVPTVVRFWSRVEIMVDGCWIWDTQPASTRYGRFQCDGKGVMAHRFAYELAYGPVPDGAELDHLCRNTFCVRPDHLEPVTHAENMRRSANTNTHLCKKGLHPWIAENIYTAPDGERNCRGCRADYSRLRSAS